MSSHETDAPDAGPVPEDNLPGHHPPEEQDKPPLDRFAARLGVPPEGEEPTGPRAAPDVDELGPSPSTVAGVAEIAAVTALGEEPAPGVPTAADAAVTDELGLMAPVAEVQEAARSFAKASVRLFVITPVKVGWYVGGALGRAALRRLR